MQGWGQGQGFWGLCRVWGVVVSVCTGLGRASGFTQGLGRFGAQAPRVSYQAGRVHASNVWST